MRRMPSQIELYEEMCRLSSHMAAADDDGLVADIALKRNLIQRILDDDAEVRRHTEPWMERVRHFLGDAERMRYIKQASLGDAEAAPN
jgi:flagellar protein FliT